MDHISRNSFFMPVNHAKEFSKNVWLNFEYLTKLNDFFSTFLGSSHYKYLDVLGRPAIWKAL